MYIAWECFRKEYYSSLDEICECFQHFYLHVYIRLFRFSCFRQSNTGQRCYPRRLLLVYILFNSGLHVIGSHIQANVVIEDIWCSNGILHITDNILHLPTRTVKEEIELRPSLS